MRHTRIHTLFVAGLVLAGLAAAAPAASTQETVTLVREASRAWLGVSLFAEEDTPGQMRVTRVFPGSPAADAGVREGDVVLRIGDRAATGEALQEMSTRLSPGDTVRLRLRRDGAERDVSLVAAGRPGPQVLVERALRLRGDSLPGARGLLLDSVLVRMGADSVFHLERDGRSMVIRLRGDSLRALADSLLLRADTLRRSISIRGRPDEARAFTFPAPDSAALQRMQEAVRLRGEVVRGEAGTLAGGLPFVFEVGRRALAGAELAPMNEGLARYFATREGLLVTRVSPESPAGRAGLEAGDVVVRAAGRPVTTVEELREAVRRDEDGRITLEVVRQRRRQEVELQWDGDPTRVLERTRTYTRVVPRREGAERR